MPSNLEIAQAATLRPISEVAASLGLGEDDIELYGRYKAKISLSVLERLADRPRGKYIDVTAITPTPLGEGKTTTTVGLGMGLNYIGKKAVIAIRQPSLGPVFGIKGGAAGGGYAQIVPMEDFNLHLTGDTHAVTAAHNLCAAFLDNSLMHGNPLGIDPYAITWRRALDVNDRALRDIVIGLGGKDNGVPRESGFDITAASEVMAILALTNGLHDMRERLGRIVIALDQNGKFITADDLHIGGAMTVVMHDAIKPNLLQTLDNTPALVHAGPFGNIAHGNSSILADLIGIHCADYLVTESGFAADMGFEKFADIKCRYSGLTPDAAVIVATVRALKMHSGQFKVVAGRPLDPALLAENVAAVEQGAVNLVAHIENVRKFGIPVVVAINLFAEDKPAEVECIRRVALQAGAFAAVPAAHYAEGAKGAAALAEAVVAAAAQPSDFHFLYPLDAPLKDKINTIATQIYGAAEVDYSPDADKKLAAYEAAGYGELPICMAKTHLSLSHEPTWKGRPTGYTLPVREVRLSAGAGFVYPLCGTMMTMPGYGTAPSGQQVDIDEDGRIVGLF
ncbi:MAG: formate--tetrahydrofolate ligase [Candidatus Chloroheliales bacterium]|nr:MAG: formate--tetrahydrofolate ligase [Chloroflexota bacterium]